MPLLSPEQYRTTFGEPMRRVVDEAPPLDFWPYFDTIPASDFDGHDCSAGEVEYVWREPTGRFEHVLVNSTTQNVFMVIVLDLRNGTVVGHHLLNLNREYGIS